MFGQRVVFDVFAEVPLSHTFKAKFFFVQAVFKMDIGCIQLVPHF